MNTTTLEPSFLVAVLHMMNFKGKAMAAAEACLLRMALAGGEFTAADIPESVTRGNHHLAGAATGALVSMGLLVVVRRIKSPNPNAKGRKLDVLQLAPLKRGTALTWLRENELPAPVKTEQLELIA